MRHRGKFGLEDLHEVWGLSQMRRIAERRSRELSEDGGHSSA
jgi:hypothetical protein